MMQSISGIVKKSGGEINFLNESIMKANPKHIVEMGLTQVPEGRRIFTGMSVYENLMMGAFLRKDKDGIKRDYEKVCEYSYPFSSKYSGINNYNNYNCVLGKINKKEIKEIYKNWLELRKNTHNIYDIFMNVFSVNYFIEIALSTVTNCMEGYYKCIHKATLKKTVRNKTGKIETRNKEFKDIMKEYLNTNEGKIIFSSKDRQVLKIYTKLTNHRNYFAHLDKKKKRFYGDSNLYMLLKIKLLFRISMLKDINQNVEIDYLEECIKDIEANIQLKNGV